MSKGLLSTLTYMYRFVSLGRGLLTREEMQTLRGSADTMTGKARDMINRMDEGEISQEAAIDLNQAALVDQHIDEMVDWMLRQEVV